VSRTWRIVLNRLAYQQACNFMLSTVWTRSFTVSRPKKKMCRLGTWVGEIIAGNYGGSSGIVVRAWEEAASNVQMQGLWKSVEQLVALQGNNVVGDINHSFMRLDFIQGSAQAD